MSGSLLFLSLVNMFNYLDRYVLTAVSPLVEKDLGLSKFQVGALMSIFMIGYMLSSPFFGYLGDRRHRPRLMAVGCGLWSVATVFSGMATNFVTLMLARIGVGVGEASYATIAPGYLGDICKDKRQTNIAMSVFYLAIPLGAALGYGWGAWAATRWGWSWAFFLAGAPGVFLTLLVWRMPDVREKGGVEGLGTSLLASFRGYGILPVLYKMRGYRNIVIGYTAFSFAIGGFGAWAPNYCVDVFHAELTSVGMKLGLVTLFGGVAGTAIGAKWGSIFVGKGYSSVGGFTRFAAIMTAIASPFGVLLLLTSDVDHFVVYLFMVETFMFAAQAPINTAILASVPKSMTAQAFAICILTIHALGDVISPSLAGLIADLAPGPVEARMPAGMSILSLAVFATAIFWWYQSLDRLGGDAPSEEAR